MEIKTLSPAEIASVWVENSVRKAAVSTLKTILLGVFAGIFVGLGGFAYLTALGSIQAAGFGRLLGASVFPVGFMLVIFCGAELFTGNDLLVIACLDKKISGEKLARNWFLVFIGNIIGSYLLAWLIYIAGMAGTAENPGELASVVLNMTASKTAMTFTAALVRGILCGILVSLAFWFQAASKDLIGKIFAVWFPVMLFMFCGFEHSIANMFFLPLGQLLGAPATFGAVWLNIIPAAVGNLIGGAGIIAAAYYYIYVYKPASSNLPPHKSARRKKK